MSINIPFLSIEYIYTLCYCERLGREVLMSSKSKYERNIKVNAKTSSGRTSTTINYTLCNYYFFHALEKEKEAKFKTIDERRKWLERQVQTWVNEQPTACVDSGYYEEMLAKSIFNEGIRRAKELYHSDNLQLDL